MAAVYVTIGGEQWDEIAKAVYGAEKHADFLMAQNLPLLDVYEFDEGVEVRTPPLPPEAAETLPEWRRSA